MLAQQQSQLLLRQMAQTSADNLATQQESIFAQLVRTNSTVADFENKKTISEQTIVNRTNTISNLRLEKANEITRHDRNIGNYEEAVRNNESEIRNLTERNTNLSTANSAFLKFQWE